MTHSSRRAAATLRYRAGAFEPGERQVPEETAIAIAVGGTTHAVMMATPDDVEDLALGLAMNEGIVRRVDEIEDLEILASPLGIECRMQLCEERARAYVARRRMMTGPVGCGLCGVESLELALVSPPRVEASAAMPPAAIISAMRAMAAAQELGRTTRAVHAAAFHRPGEGAVVVREDVGRHNALDKVAGFLARQKRDAADGLLTLTSRVSVELIQKAAMMGCPVLAAVSVPTALAIETAQAAGITLVAVARGEDFEIFTHPARIDGGSQAAP